MKILGGIVLYHPDRNRLRENLSAVRGQVDGIAVWNNGGMARSDLDEDIVFLSQKDENIGIASALNALCAYACENGYDWILTLDQDSVVPAGLVSTYAHYTADASIGMVCPCVLDRNYGTMAYDTGSGPDSEEVDACITSGSLLRLSAWKEAGGFWDALFIDMVDFDLCWSLREKGYRIVRVNSLSLYHEIGHSRKVVFLGKENVVFNHPPVRCYYNARNTLAVGRKHHMQKKCRRWLLRRILLINLYERQRFKKDMKILKGIMDSYRLGKE